MVPIFLMFLFMQATLLQYSRSQGRRSSNDKISCDKRNIEEYIDHIYLIVKNVSSQMSDTISVPGQTGLVNFTKGEIEGFRTLKCDIPAKVYCNRHSLVFIAKLKVDKLTGRYNWSKQLITQKVNGVIVLNCNRFEAKIKVIQENKPGAYLNLKMFNIMKIEGIDLHFTPFNNGTWVFSELIEPAIDLFRSSIAMLVKKQIKKDFAKELSLVSIPLK